MTDRRHAAVFCRSFAPYSETFVYDEVTHHQRWSVEVFARERVNAEAFPLGTVHTPRGRLERLGYQLTTYAPRFERILRAGGHRLVHAHFGTGAVYALPHALRLRLPLLVTFHGFDVGLLAGPGRLPPSLWRYWALSRVIFRRAALLLCASEELVDLVGRLSGRPGATRLYRLGIDLGRFRFAERDGPATRVAMVGRFVEKKGHLDGIEAFARVAGRLPGSTLTIAGAGPLEPLYRARVAALGLGGRVAFPGPLAPPAVARLLAESDVLLAPSRTARDGDRESGLLVVKEASATGAAVVATRHGGIPESLDDGVTGHLVAEGDVEAMAAHLQALLADPARCRAMGRAGRAKMERAFDLDARVADLERIYDEVA